MLSDREKIIFLTGFFGGLLLGSKANFGKLTRDQRDQRIRDIWFTVIEELRIQKPDSELDKSLADFQLELADILERMNLR
jgi:hypothetical protein